MFIGRYVVEFFKKKYRLILICNFYFKEKGNIILFLFVFILYLFWVKWMKIIDVIIIWIEIFV